MTQILKKSKSTRWQKLSVLIESFSFSLSESGKKLSKKLLNWLFPIFHVFTLLLVFLKAEEISKISFNEALKSEKESQKNQTQIGK